jgi:hypothetical protein
MGSAALETFLEVFFAPLRNLKLVRNHDHLCSFGGMKSAVAMSGFLGVPAKQYS